MTIAKQQLRQHASPRSAVLRTSMCSYVKDHEGRPGKEHYKEASISSPTGGLYFLTVSGYCNFLLLKNTLIKNLSNQDLLRMLDNLV